MTMISTEFTKHNYMIHTNSHMLWLRISLFSIKLQKITKQKKDLTSGDSQKMRIILMFSPVILIFIIIWMAFDWKGLIIYFFCTEGQFNTTIFHYIMPKK